MPSPLAVGPFAEGSDGDDPDREGDEFRESAFFLGRHLRTLSTDALQGCTCSGYENMTRITIAALPMVEATEGASKFSC